MQIAIHPEVPSDAMLRSAWNGVVERMEPPEIFYTYEWAWAIQHAYSRSMRPWVLLLWDNANLVGAVALTVDRDNRVARFLGGTTSDYCDFLSQPELRPVLIENALVELRRIGVRAAVLANLPSDSATVEAVGTVAGRVGFHVFRRPAYACAQVQLGAPDGRQVLKQTVGKKEMFRRKLRALARIGEVKLQHLQNFDDVERALPLFCDMHVARFLATGRISSLATSERRAFLRELSRQGCERGWVSLSCLSIEERPVAWNFGFQFKGSWFWYQPTFDTEYEECSPGYCLLSKVVLEACDRPDMRIVDLGLGEEAYKDRFANATRQTLDITLTTSRAERTRVWFRYQGSKTIKRSARAESLVRSVAHRVQKVLDRGRRTGVSGLASWVARRTRNALWSHDQVEFYEWINGDKPGQESASWTLCRLGLHELAQAAMRYEADPETLTYLIRCAQRLRTLSLSAKGYALIGHDAVPLHFCWAAEFNGFYMSELETRLVCPGGAGMLIFDCWTPRDARGHGCYAMAIQLLAQKLAEEGNHPWIFSAASNVASIRGIAKARFQYRYSIIRDTRLGLHRVTDLRPISTP